MPLTIAVPAASDSEASLLTHVRGEAPLSDETELDLGPDAPEAELSILDYWTDLPEVTRSRVRAVISPVAGALMRFDDRRFVGITTVGMPSVARDRAPNAQARWLLMAEHPDTWTLALERGPGVEADLWRWRLSVAVRRWRINVASGCDVRSPGAPSVDDRSWLDAELCTRLRSRSTSQDSSVFSNWGSPQTGDDARPREGSADEKVLRGKRSRLFLAHDSHDSHRQIMGERMLSREELDAWKRETDRRMADVGKAGSRLIQLIGPAPQVVHASDLPDSMSVSDTRPALQILRSLTAMRPTPDILYPEDELIRASHVRDPFGKTDSHWNDLGAYVAYEAVMDRIGESLPVRRLARDDVSFHDTCYIGDLGIKLRPQRAATFLRARIDRPEARLVEDNRVRNHGRSVVYHCEAAPPCTCVVFGDSWAYPMLLYLAESFRRLAFYHRVNVLDRQPLADERPELVLMILTERFCTAIPDDRRAIPFQQVVAKKLRTGDLVADAPLHERYEFLHSVALDRRLPSAGGFKLPVDRGHAGS